MSEKLYEYETKELLCHNEKGQKIFGIAYIPKGEKKKFPLVIDSHGLNGTYRINVPYAEGLAAHGVATYVYDFIGGSVNTSSDGTTLDLSVLTNVADLQVVLKEAKTWDFVDPGCIYLKGESQGGLVSTIVGPKVEDQIRGLILLYPAYVFYDDHHSQFKTLDDVPERFKFRGWLDVSKHFIADTWDYDVYADMKKFNKPVLIIQGDADNIGPLKYAERAVQTFPNAKLHVLNGEGHGYKPDGIKKALDYIYEFLRDQKAI